MSEDFQKEVLCAVDFYRKVLTADGVSQDLRQDALTAYTRILTNHTELSPHASYDIKVLGKGVGRLIARQQYLTIKEKIDTNRKIEAIRDLRAAIDLPLHDAKSAVEDPSNWIRS